MRGHARRYLSRVSPKPNRCQLTEVAEFAELPLEKRAVVYLLRMAELAPEERGMQLHEALKVGLARCAMRLTSMPMGFGRVPSMMRVAGTYVQNFQQIVEFERGQESLFGVAGFSREYMDLAQSIFNQHTNTMQSVALGVLELKKDLKSLFGEDTDLSGARERLQLVRDIENSLDEFFTERTTMRLLIKHVAILNGNEGQQKRESAETVGIVDARAQPIHILLRAYAAARFLCMREYQEAPDLLVNGVSHTQHGAEEIKALHPYHFPYVQQHLFYIFVELLKNAARASIESEGAGQPAPIQVFAHRRRRCGPTIGR